MSPVCVDRGMPLPPLICESCFTMTGALRHCY